MFDFTIGFLGMLLVSPLLSWLFKKVGIHFPKRNWVILMLPISILVHILVGKITPLTKDFLDPDNHYFVKLIVVCCCILGATGIRRIVPASKSR